MVVHSASQTEAYDRQIDGFYQSWNFCHAVVLEQKGRKSEG